MNHGAALGIAVSGHACRPRAVLRAALAALVCLAGFRAAGAVTGSVQVATGGGLSLTVDTRWPDGPGYRPVRVQLASVGLATADRRLSVEVLRLRSGGREGYDLRVVRDVDLPAGSGPVAATIAVPQLDRPHDFEVNVRENGELVPGLSAGTSDHASFYTSASFEGFPSVLVVGDKSANASGLASVPSVQEHNGSQPSPPIQISIVPRPNSALPTAAQLSASELPDRWIDYTNLDVVCLSLDELAGLAKTRPEAFRAVLDWVAAGGNLWVYGVGDEFPRIGELEDLLGLAPGSKDKASEPAARGWNSQEFPSPEHPHFLLRELQMGLVVALQPEDPFPGTKEQWDAVLTAVGQDRYLWTRRHGLSMSEPNAEFWNFLIPGVGLVPAVQFGVLITLFALAVGPANYLLLRRRKRLHLLVVTVPLSAAAVTLALFLYALVADGLGTRVRVRSVTHLDQRSGRAVCWSRMSYYAGLAPSGGLRFGADTAVYPLEQTPPEWRGQQQPRRELVWGDDQWLSSGWLRARMPTQLVTVRCRASRRGLEIEPVRGDAGHVRVTNRLGTPVRQLLVRTADGTCYWAEGIDQDGTVRAQRVKLRDAMMPLVRTYNDNRPHLPDGMRPGSLQSPRQRRYGRYGPRQRSGEPPSTWTSRMELSLRMLQWPPQDPGVPSFRQPSLTPKSEPDWSEPDRATSGPWRAPKPRRYIAVVEESPEAATGIPSARQEAGYHVILGEF